MSEVAQSVAELSRQISELVEQLQTSQAEQVASVKRRDQAKASAAAAAIDRQTAKLKELSDQLAASTGGPDQSLPGGGGGVGPGSPDTPDAGGPGKPPGTSGETPETPGQGPAGGTGRPDQSLPGEQPEGGQELPGGPPQTPDQSLPEGGAAPKA